jgi:hypothetical protein
MRKLELEIIKDNAGYDVDDVVAPKDLIVVQDLPNKKVTLTADLTVDSPRHEYILRITAAGASRSDKIAMVAIDWGDSTSMSILTSSYTYFDQILNAYSTSGTFNIVVTITYANGDIVVSDPLKVNPSHITTLFAVQYMIERRQHTRFGNTYRILKVVDWTDVASPTFIDTLSDLNYQYRYRVKFRTLDSAGFAIKESAFSNYSVVN